MSNNGLATVSRVGLTVLGAVLCVVLGYSPAAAEVAAATDKAAPPVVSKGETASVRYSSAIIQFAVAPGEGKDLSLVVFYGGKDGGTEEGSWANKMDDVAHDKAAGRNDYTAVLKKLDRPLPAFAALASGRGAQDRLAQDGEVHPQLPRFARPRRRVVRVSAVGCGCPHV